MIKQLFACISLTAACVFTLNAAPGVVTMKTSAPAGTALRIQTMPYDAEITGVDKGKFYGEYYSKGEGSEITISAEELSQLEVYGCSLSELKTAGAPALSILKCYDNSLTELDLEGNLQLVRLNAAGNKLAQVDLTANRQLEIADISRNVIKKLNVGRNEVLRDLKIGDNPLEAIDLSGCPKIESLYIQNCGLSDIDLKENLSLNRVCAFGNNLKGESMDSFIAGLPAANGSNGSLYIVCTSNPEESNECLMRHIAEVSQKSWLTYDFEGIDAYDYITGTLYRGADYVPDVSDRTITMTTKRGAGETIRLNVKASGDVSISGVMQTGSPVGDKTFTLTGNKVVITGDVSGLTCSGNDLTDLTFDGGILLTELKCDNNALTKLDVSGASALSLLMAESNQLTSLYLDNCPALERVNFFQNKIKGKAMTAIMNALPVVDRNVIFVINTKAPEGTENNVVLTTDVNIALSKGWRVKDYSDGANYGMGVDYAGTEPVGPALPDEYFTITRSTKDHIMFSVRFSDPEYEPVVEGATMSGWNGESLTLDMTEQTVKIYGDATELLILLANIEGIDVSNLPSLRTLNVALNDLKSLDLAGNAELTSLSCEGNLLSTIDFSGCPKIRYINAYGNVIDKEGMTSLIETLPVCTAEDFGTFVVVDPTYTQNANVCLSTHVNAAKAKYWAPYLKDGVQLLLYDGDDVSAVNDVVGDENLRYDPAKGVIISDAEGVVRVFSLAGTLLLSGDGAEGLDVSSLPNGVYIVTTPSVSLKLVK